MRNLALGLTSIADNDILEEVSVRHVAKGPRSNNVSFKRPWRSPLTSHKCTEIYQLAFSYQLLYALYYLLAAELSTY